MFILVLLVSSRRKLRNHTLRQRPNAGQLVGRERFYSIDSTATFQSFASDSSNNRNVLLISNRIVQNHEEREAVLNRIQEVNERVRAQTPAPEPFSWAANLSSACSLAERVLDEVRRILDMRIRF